MRLFPFPQLSCSVIAAILVVTMSQEIQAVDRVVLRNLDIVSGKAVTSFDEDGVIIDQGRPITWDQIERGILAEKQADFDKMLKEIGEPLYRIRQRLQVEDYASCLSHAEKIYPRFSERRSPSAYMVAQSLMWARIATGQREKALIPYFRCYEMLRQIDTSKVPIPGDRRLQFDKNTALTPELLPIWFHPQAAKAALPQVTTSLRTLSKPLPTGARIYYATLSLAAGDRERAQTLLNGLTSDKPEIKQLRELLLTQMDVTPSTQPNAVVRFKNLLPQLDASNRVLGMYWLGVAQTMGSISEEQQDGILQLLRIPAMYADTYPDMAAAALHTAMTTLEKNQDTPSSKALRKELLSRFGNTYHAVQVKQTLNPGKDS